MRNIHRVKHLRNGEGERRRDRPAARRGPQPRRHTPLKLGVGLGIVAVGGAAALLASRGWDRDGVAPPGETAWAMPSASGPSPLAAAEMPPAVRSSAGPALGSLPPPAPGTRVPLNDLDPVTGKATSAISPTTDYRGYVIAFCCENSEGYRGGWAGMSESQKDAFVRRYLK